MQEKKVTGWEIATAVLVVLLVVAVGAAISFGILWGQQKNTTKLNQRALRAEIDDWKAKYKQVVDKLNQSTSSSAVNPQATTSQQQQPSDEEILIGLATGRATQSTGKDIPWKTSVQVVGDWARVGIGADQQYAIQGESMYFHKVNGTWTFVTEGTGLTPADVPGCPEELILPYQG